MRLLHTSDWHIGTAFDAVSRDDDHRLFFAWLIETIAEEEVDVLVIAGDVFDHVNPSAEAQRAYYELMCTLESTRLRRVIVVAGNHDSAARLEAPREVLKSLRVDVVGYAGNDDETLERSIVPVRSASGEVELVVLAVPYVHEYRLGVRVVAEPGVLQADLKQKFRALYTELVDRASSAYPGVPLVATGHLAIVGSTREDAPAEIHMIGSIGGLPTDIFDPRLAYVALGHVHRAYRVSDTPLAYYSGSPITFSRTEVKPDRSVRLVDFDRTEFKSTRALAVPSFRRFEVLEGSLAEVKNAIEEKKGSSDELPPIVCVTIRVDTYDPKIEQQLRETAEKNRVVLSDLRIERKALETTGDAALDTRTLADMEPLEVFRKFCVSEKVDPDPELLALFEQTLALAKEVEP